MGTQRCVLTVDGDAGSNAVDMALTPHGDDAWVDWIGMKLLLVGMLMLSDYDFRCDLDAILEEHLEECDLDAMLEGRSEGHA